MRITKDFAETLSKRLAHRAFQADEAAIKAERKRLAPLILAELHGDKLEVLETLGRPWVDRAKTLQISFRDNNHYFDLRFEFDEEMVVPISSNWHSCGLDLRDKPELMEQAANLHAMITRSHQNFYNLERELHHNIMSAKSLKKLLECWPDAADDIATVAAEFATPDTEVPLASILKRYQVALPAPAEVAA